MLPLKSKLTIGFLLFALTVGCAQAPNANIPVTNETAETTATAENPATKTKVVALTSLSADILHRLDEDSLVGVSGSRLLAQDPKFSDLPKVSEGRTPPNLEKIVALQPDLVIGAVGFHDQILEKLDEVGIETMAVAVPDWRSLEELTRTLAEKIGADPEPLLTEYASFLPAEPQATDSAIVLVSNQPIMAPNRDSWAGDLLQQFAVNNLVAELQGNSPQQGYITLSPEKILEANPEMLLLVDVGDDSLEQLKSAPFWSELDAVKNDRVYTFDYYGLVNPGSIAAIQTASQKLQELSTAVN
ncbi:ABC transporter substrate-binding protein [[Limnothrix rosea] IAM M-220]|uniref:ABC transporter substrate-binding protein n=1 Tax=[Limnothrix rosea] IAM M-220 TaxID=454133 RepID=UPI000966D1BA|nr:ABC transporter substrate-binding protein [[Limnothrix rosea] IAM M-220]OKH15131.1 iron ABC transporter substrate-binding protein [[Limnothrix rosea] IAM M-220]